MNQTQHTPSFALGHLMLRFRGKISLTLLLVMIEAGIMLLFPLFIGFAINGLLNDSYGGVIGLGLLGASSLAIGAGRRVYDTRAYASIFHVVVNEVVSKETQKGSPISKISARTKLFNELVEFLENSFPEMVNSFIGLFGILIILAFLNVNLFIACLIATVIILIIYVLSQKKNFRLNKGYNDVMEAEVDMLDSGNKEMISDHFKRLMGWNIKLSDFETLNFSLVWLVMIGLLVYAVVEAVSGDVTEYGTIMSLVIYVFEFISAVVVLPLFYQQLIRLNEITSRLNN